ncbi:MAG: alpha/beta fold hydrolase [Chloroflexi bacterium]|nr:alpha/beta fold hydrolase [Chloroflexota bacterium]
MDNAIQSETGFVEVDGAPIFYEVAGEGPALVLIHEGIADSRMYDGQFMSLAQRYRVVRYDLHGFGRSGTPKQAYTHHGALRTLLQHLSIDRTAILGMSLGGMIAIDFALTYPEMVGTLLLLASGVGGYLPGEATAALAAPMADAFKAGDFLRAIELSVRFWVDGPNRGPEEVDSAIRERVRSMYTDVLRRSRDGGRQADSLQPPACTRLGEIRVPTLIVVGAGDVPDILDQADLLDREIAGARKIVLPRVAHVLNMERPAEINAMILDFLEQPYSAE